jgi:hypothetical protein
MGWRRLKIQSAILCDIWQNTVNTVYIWLGCNDINITKKNADDTAKGQKWRISFDIVNIRIISL